VQTTVAARLESEYIERRLDEWGREFRLASHSEPHAKTILAILVEHGGFMPRREGGFRPEVTVSPTAWEIETIVANIHRSRPDIAAVLRAYYSGSGRHRVERRQQAEALYRNRISARNYYDLHDKGVCWILGALTRG